MSDPTKEQQADPAPEQKPLFSIGTREYDIDAAVSKITNADNHISTLEQERKADKARLEELEAKLKSQSDLEAKLDEALSRLGNPQQGSSNQNTGSTDPVDIQELRNSLLREAVQAASQTTSDLKQQEIQQANTQANIDLAKKKFGDQYEAKLREEASKLGMSDADIQNLAKGGTETFKRLFNLNVQANPSDTSPTGSVRSGFRSSTAPSNLPDPTKAFTAADRVRLMQERLQAKAKQHGLI